MPRTKRPLPHLGAALALGLAAHLALAAESDSDSEAGASELELRVSPLPDSEDGAAMSFSAADVVSSPSGASVSSMPVTDGAAGPRQAAAAPLTERALSLLGVRYRRGGNTPDYGLDCSGLVRLVFHDAWGIDLPRRAEEISRIGQRVDRTALKPGDLIFFNTMRRAFSHVAIYLGDGRFIHAPASGGRVRVESLDVIYWAKRFSGARRIGE